MTTSKTVEVRAAEGQGNDEWLQITPGERLRIRISSAQTMGAYSVLEVVADPGNGVPMHIHGNEEEHFVVLEGWLDVAVGHRRWDAPVGTSVTVKRGVPHAWCNSSHEPLRLLVVFTPGHIEGLFRAAAGVGEVDNIAAIAARYGTRLIGPPLHEWLHSIYSPRKFSEL